MLGVGHDLYVEAKRLGRPLKVREAIVLLEARDKDSADRLRALGEDWLDQVVSVRGFGRIRSVRVGGPPGQRSALVGRRNDASVQIDAH